MLFVIDLLLNAAVLFILSVLIPSVTIKNYGTAIWVALVIGLLNATIGFVIRLPLDILTLGLITFLVKLFVSAIMIKLADYLLAGFKVNGWIPAFIIAICMAIAGTLLSQI
jgi:putative membrane protein